MHIPPDARVLAPPPKRIRPLPAILGDSLRAARLRAGLNKTETANLVALSRTAYGRLEQGQMLPSIATLYRLCATLGTTPNELLGYPATLPPEVVAAAKDALRRRVRHLDGHHALALIQLLPIVR